MSAKFDYILIGAGTAGCVLAGRLSEDPAVRVALLEAGPSDDSALLRCPAGAALLARTGQAQWRFDSQPQPGLNGRSARLAGGKVIGGGSAIGHMVYTHGHPGDYDEWAAQGNPGWAFEDVRPYFRRADQQWGGAKTLDGIGGTPGPLPLAGSAAPNPCTEAFVQAALQAGHSSNTHTHTHGDVQEGFGRYRVTERGGERVSAASAYLTPHLGRPNLTVITGAQATRVLLEGKRAVGVEFAHEGYLKQLQAGREVVLCAGALLSPQLLMLSGIGPHAHLVENGIATRHHLPGVGQHLHAPPGLVHAVHAPATSDLFGLSPAGLWRIARGIADWRRGRAGILTSNLVEAGGFAKSQSTETVPDLQLHFSTRRVLDEGRRLAWRRGYSIEVTVLRPQSRGSVRLDGKDPFTPPLIDPNLLGDRDDMERLMRGFKLVRDIVAQPALAALHGGAKPRTRAQTELQLEQAVRDHTGSGHAPVGSCRMGPGGSDVVDAQLRVHGLTGLRVADASVMPGAVSGATLAVVSMIAEKAADLLRTTPP